MFLKGVFGQEWQGSVGYVTSGRKGGDLGLLASRFCSFSSLRLRVRVHNMKVPDPTVDDLNPALSTVRNMP